MANRGEAQLVRQAPTGKLLALDVGLARIGVAVCDPLQLAARPLTVITRRSRDEDFAVLATLVQREEVQAIVCGLPLNMDGSEGAQAQSVRKWALRLAKSLHVQLGAAPPILFWDERLSSYEAQSILAERRAGGKAKKAPRSPDDDLAAGVILQSYLDARHTPEWTDYGRIELERAHDVAPDQGDTAAL
jgi:putative Holliday junction resolvase